MFRIACIIATLAFTIDLGASHSCESFNEVEMLLEDDGHNKFNKTVDGCIERIEFGNVTVTKAYIKGQSVPNLGRDSVRNMNYLNTVVFSKCDLSSITPVAFRNVPRLMNVEITRCKLQTIPRGVFEHDLIPKLQQLKIGYNKISAIEDEAFYELTSLKRIYACYNKLEEWRSQWFVNATALELIDFRNNKIKAIPKRAFANFIRLKQVLFDNNDITELQPDAFKDIRRLEYLGLSHNKLTVLEQHSFPNTIRVFTLAVGANYLNYLSNELLKKLTAIELVMDYNPWKCPCLERIYYWLYLKGGKIKKPESCVAPHVPICATPIQSNDTCLDHIDSELTQRYISTLRNLSKPLADQNCAMLD